MRRAVQLLPGTLQKSRVALQNVATFASVLGPTLDDLRPFARNLDEVNASTTKLANEATGPVKNQIRPFVKAAREPIPNLTKAAKRLGKATPPLTTVGNEINRLGNMAAYNPNGAEAPGAPGRDEGYLFWGAWLGHNGDSVFSTGGRQRPRPPHLSDDGMRRGAGAARLQPVRAADHRARGTVRSRRTVRWGLLR